MRYPPRATALHQTTLRKASSCALPLLALSLFLFVCAPSLAQAETASGAQKTLTLCVVDKTTQKPMAGAEVVVEMWPREAHKKQEHVTNEQGECALAIPQPQAEYTSVSVEAAGRVPISVGWEYRETADRQEPIPERFVVPLEKGSSIGGVVRDKRGKPIKSARVGIYVEAGDAKVRPNLGDWHTRTDKKGKWRCDMIPAEFEGLRIDIEHRDYLPAERRVQPGDASMEKLHSLSAVVTMEEGRTVAGRVLDENGQTIQGAKVRVGHDLWNAKPVTTNANGSFEVNGCEKGSVHIGIMAEGKAPLFRRLLPEDAAQPLEMTLAPGRTIQFRVVDKDGVPIEGVHVRVDNYGGYREGIDVDLTTDKDGRATWDSAPSDSVQYGFQKKDFASLGGVELVADGQEHVVTLPRPVTVSGTVVDKATGAPISAFRVVPVLDWLRGGIPYIERGQSFPAQDGRFEWKADRTDVGNYVRIEADGYVPAMSPMFRVADGEKQTFAFALEKGQDLTGVVLGTDGKPFEGADVLLRTPMQDVGLFRGALEWKEGVWHVETDESGRFSFPVEPGPCIVAAVHDSGFAQATADAVRASGQLRLEPYARIEARLLRNGKPVSDFGVRMYPVQTYNSDELLVSSQYSTTTNDEGVFTFERVLPGRFSLSAELGPWEPSELTSSEHLPLEIKPGETVEVTLGGKGHTVVGKVVLPDGFDRKMHWDWGINYLVALKEGISLPDGVQAAGFDWRNGWNEAWNSSREGGAYLSTLHRHFVRLNPDGTFRIDGIEDGDYAFVLKIYDPPPGMG